MLEGNAQFMLLTLFVVIIAYHHVFTNRLYDVEDDFRDKQEELEDKLPKITESSQETKIKHRLDRIKTRLARIDRVTWHLTCCSAVFYIITALLIFKIWSGNKCIDSFILAGFSFGFAWMALTAYLSYK